MKHTAGLLGLLAGGACLLGATVPAAGQTLAGQLLDTSSGTAVPFSRVTLVTPDGEAVVFTFTDPQGFFAVTAPEPGEYLVNAEALFYWTYTEGPVTLAASDTLVVEFGLTPHPSELEGIVVEARSRPIQLILNGYYERVNAGLGYHLDHVTLSKHAFRKASDIFLTIPGVRLLDSSFGDKEPLFARAQFWGSLSGPGQAAACFPSFYVDGVLLGMGGDLPTEIDRFLVPEDIQAMEVYTSPEQVPPVFAGLSSRCGAIAVWTRPSR